MKIELIELQEQDLEFVKEIYQWYILNSTATFHTDPITTEELKSIIPIGHSRYKSFIIRYEGEDCGYCYISRYKPRQAYDRTAEITVYLKPGYAGRGIGKETMKLLEATARELGIAVLLGIITGENEISIHLFEKCGYEKCAHFRQVGEKFNRLLDVVAYQKILI
jgi:L-amino acid N-acyltransferase YncA